MNKDLSPKSQDNRNKSSKSKFNNVLNNVNLHEKNKENESSKSSKNLSNKNIKQVFSPSGKMLNQHSNRNKLESKNSISSIKDDKIRSKPNDDIDIKELENILNNDNINNDANITKRNAIKELDFKNQDNFKKTPGELFGYQNKENVEEEKEINFEEDYNEDIGMNNNSRFAINLRKNSENVKLEDLNANDNITKRYNNENQKEKSTNNKSLFHFSKTARDEAKDKFVLNNAKTNRNVISKYLNDEQNKEYIKIIASNNQIIDYDTIKKLNENNLFDFNLSDSSHSYKDLNQDLKKHQKAIYSFIHESEKKFINKIILDYNEKRNRLLLKSRLFKSILHLVNFFVGIYYILFHNENDIIKNKLYFTIDDAKNALTKKILSHRNLLFYKYLSYFESQSKK